MRSRGPVSRRARDNVLVPPTGVTLGRFLRSELYNKKIGPLIAEFAFHEGHPPQRSVEEKLEFATEKYLPYLEADIIKRIDPKLRDYGRVQEALEQLASPTNKLPASVAEKAKEVLRKYEAINWDAARSHRGRSPATAAHTAAPTGHALGPAIREPPSDHPIWGDDGIMRGLVLSRGPGGKLTYKIDSRYLPARDALVAGDNGLAVGQWFANRTSAILHGAHAQPIRGIAGDADRGAYSIVVAAGGAYDGVDQDLGDTLYYSAEGGAGKDARHKAESKLNRALDASWRTGSPVRVLRSANPRSFWAPPCGLRYDGLYRITAVQSKRNQHGGLFRQFKFERLPGQPSLEDVRRASPTAREQADYERIKLGY